MPTAGGGSQPGTSGKAKRPVKTRVEVFGKSEVRLANGRCHHPGEPMENTGNRKRMRSPSVSPERRRRVEQLGGLRKMVDSHKKKREKAMRRKRKYVKRMRATRGEKSILELNSVKEPQRRDYSRRLEKFYAFADHFELDIAKEKGLDEVLCEYADALYMEGEDCNCGQKLLAALELEMPEWHREGVLKLPRFRRALKGWRKLAPPQTRLPLLEFLKSSISGLMILP